MNPRCDGGFTVRVHTCEVYSNSSKGAGVAYEGASDGPEPELLRRLAQCLEGLGSRVDVLCGEISGARADVHAEIDAMRGEVRLAFDGVCRELRTELEDLRTASRGGYSRLEDRFEELSVELGGFRLESRHNFGALGGELVQGRNEMQQARVDLGQLGNEIQQARLDLGQVRADIAGVKADTVLLQSFVFDTQEAFRRHTADGHGRQRRAGSTGGPMISA